MSFLSTPMAYKLSMICSSNWGEPHTYTFLI